MSESGEMSCTIYYKLDSSTLYKFLVVSHLCMV